MNPVLTEIAHAFAASPMHKGAMFLLSKVPGFPPVIQTVHVLSVGAIMGSIVLLDLKVLGVALPSQRTGEMIKRLLPWTWWALLFLAISGLVLVFARPNRYFVNPVFGIKLALLVPAVLLALVFYFLSKRETDYWEQPTRRVPAKTMAGVSLLLWLGVMMAGRWIAYADYIFGE